MNIKIQKKNLYITTLCLLILVLLTGCFESSSTSDNNKEAPPSTTPSIVKCDIQPITTPPGAFPKDISCLTTFLTADVWTDGTIRTPGNELRAGRPNASYISAGILVFELPDLRGASITSANLSFTVSGSSAMNMDFHTNLNLDALRGSTTRDPIVASDFDSLGIIPPMLTIQEGIVYWDDTFPGVFETNNTADGLLASWLVCQYEQIGTGGLVYLRIAPDQDPISNLYMRIPTTSVGLVITTDGNDAPVSGTGDTVSVQMGPHYFSWTFNQDVQWGHFIDGQPWVVEPAGGNFYLTSVTPTRLNSQTVYLYPSTATSPIPVIADINITVKNPPVDHKLVGGSYLNDPNGVFGWDSRTGNGSTSLARYNTTLGWNGENLMLLAAGDSITTAKSITSPIMPDRASVLDALAILTILDTPPPSDAFRPSPIREGAARTNPEIVRYSDVKDVTPFLIPTPVGAILGLEGGTVAQIEQIYTFAWLRQLLPGPGFINSSYSSSEGISARYNNTSYLIGSAGGSYGGYMGTQRFGPLAIGSLADWLTPDERKLCQIRLIQRAIDSYGYVQAGGCLEEGAGILPGYSTLMTIAGIMLDSTQLGVDMRSVNEGINGVEPWFIFADYATSFHTDGVPAGDLVPGEVQADRQISLFFTPGAIDIPELNKENISPILSTTATTMTVQDNFYWGDSRPLYDVINLKLKITAGPGVDNTIYVITAARDFLNSNGDKFIGGNTYNYKWGGTVTINPSWTNGLPDATSTIALSITTSDAGSLASDDARWLWAVHGVIPQGQPAYIEQVKAISSSPIHNYISIQTGATLGNIIALYALNGQAYYKGGLDKFMIDASTRPGYAELLFSGSYMDAINLNNPAEGVFRGALWRQEVLNHPNVGVNFVYTGLGTDSLLIPNITSRMWYE